MVPNGPRSAAIISKVNAINRSAVTIIPVLRLMQPRLHYINLYSTLSIFLIMHSNGNQILHLIACFKNFYKYLRNIFYNTFKESVFRGISYKRILIEADDNIIFNLNFNDISPLLTSKYPHVNCKIQPNSFSTELFTTVQYVIQPSIICLLLFVCSLTDVSSI